VHPCKASTAGSGRSGERQSGARPIVPPLAQFLVVLGAADVSWTVALAEISATSVSETELS